MTSSGALCLLGAGGHAAVVAEAARGAGWNVTGAYHDGDGDGLETLGIPSLGAIADASGTKTALHAAVGDAALRRAWTEGIEDSRLPVIIHPSAIVSPSATIGAGVFVGPGAIVNAHARLEQGAIVNSGAIVEHDAVVGAFAHIAPGAVLGGAATIGDDALIGLGARVRPTASIGRAAVLGAGATAIDDVGAGIVAIGTPARPA